MWRVDWTTPPVYPSLFLPVFNFSHRSGAAPLLACALTLALGGTSALVSSDAGGIWGRRGGVAGRALSMRRGGSLEASSTPYAPQIPSLPLREAAAAVLSDAFHNKGAPSDGGDAEEVDELMPASFIEETALPTPNGLFRLRAYRIDGDLANPHIGKEPCVIYSADPGVRTSGRNVPVRVHDQCLTSEVLGSQRCDCREQLLMGMDFVAREGSVVIYLQQEGRGIGLANKVAAYAMQDIRWTPTSTWAFRRIAGRIGRCHRYWRTWGSRACSCSPTIRESRPITEKKGNMLKKKNSPFFSYAKFQPQSGPSEVSGSRRLVHAAHGRVQIEPTQPAVPRGQGVPA